MNALLKACNKHFYQLSHQVRFKIKASFPLMSVGNANTFVWDRDVIMFRGALWWVLMWLLKKRAKTQIQYDF